MTTFKILELEKQLDQVIQAYELLHEQHLAIKAVHEKTVAERDHWQQQSQTDRRRIEALMARFKQLEQ